MTYTIRLAKDTDAPAIANLIIESVRTLCRQDHQDNPEILAKWLGNKTPETMTSWIRDPESTMLVAVEDGDLLSVGSVMKTGEIALNYVLPPARFRGISRAMIGALEEAARRQGCAECFLKSTGTARSFYLARGYREGAPVTGFFGTLVYPMRKTL